MAIETQNALYDLQEERHYRNHRHQGLRPSPDPSRTAAWVVHCRVRLVLKTGDWLDKTHTHTGHICKMVKHCAFLAVGEKR